MLLKRTNLAVGLVIGLAGPAWAVDGPWLAPFNARGHSSPSPAAASESSDVTRPITPGVVTFLGIDHWDVASDEAALSEFPAVTDLVAEVGSDTAPVLRSAGSVESEVAPEQAEPQLFPLTRLFRRKADVPPPAVSDDLVAGKHAFPPVRRVSFGGEREYCAPEIADWPEVPPHPLAAGAGHSWATLPDSVISEPDVVAPRTAAVADRLRFPAMTRWFRR